MSRFTKILLMVIDVVSIHIGMGAALWLRSGTQISTPYQVEDILMWGLMVVTLVGIFILFGLYNSLWRYASVRELLQVVGACILGSGVLMGISKVAGKMLEPSIYVLYPLTLIPFIMGTRFGYRFLRRIFRRQSKYIQGIKRVMIIGAGDAASIVIRDLNSNKLSGHRVVVAVDDNSSKCGVRLHGVPIEGDTFAIPTLVTRYDVQEIIVSIPSASKERIKQILEICSQTQCKLRIFPGINESLSNAKGNWKNKVGKHYIRDVKIEDLLGREEIIMEQTQVKSAVNNQVVLVTGGGGSIGSELCRQIVKCAPRQLVVLDIYENNAYDLQMELLQAGVPKEKVKIIIGSVRDKVKLQEVFETYRPNLVFHAAAHKHVPLMEDNPSEAIKNNIFGTLNVAQCAMNYGVGKFVMISTDKAVNPTNVMGASKRVCEMIVQSINAIAPDTDFVAVRFGNVLGSNGSVIPLFKRQLEAGGPLTVTHPDIIRYFMTIPEAVRLVLEAMTFATGGEVFVLDMGKPVKILDLAKNFIKLSGLKLDEDITIEYTGLRPGEKLYEELLMEEEGMEKTDSEKIFIGKPSDITYQVLIEQLQELHKVVKQDGDIRSELMKIVPTYKMPGYNKQQVG